MIALGILTTWLTLTAAGFAGLSALSRAGKRESIEMDLAPMEHQPLVRVGARVPIGEGLLQ